MLLVAVLAVIAILIPVQEKTALAYFGVERRSPKGPPHLPEECSLFRSHRYGIFLGWQGGRDGQSLLETRLDLLASLDRDSRDSRDRFCIR